MTMDGLLLVKYNIDYFHHSKAWLSDSELSHLINAGELPSDEDRLKWFVSLSSRTDYLIWGVEYLGKPIGVSGLKHICNGQAEYWGYIGEKSLWGKGIGKLLMSEMMIKAKELDIKKIYLKVRKYNPRAYKMYIKFGFAIDNEDENMYCMSIAI